MWIWIRRLLFAVCILILNCSPTHGRYYVRSPRAEHTIKTIPVYVDCEFGAADLLEIDNAINQWNYALNGYLVLKLVETPVSQSMKLYGLEGFVIFKMSSEQPLAPIPQAAPNMIVLAFANKVGGNYIYLIRDRLKNEYMFGITMHELGHVLGSPHTSDNLMAPIYNISTYTCVDYLTISEVAKYQDLPLEELNYCVFF